MFRLVQARPGSPRERAVKRLYTCVYSVDLIGISDEGVCLQCFDAVGWVAGRASSL